MAFGPGTFTTAPPLIGSGRPDELVAAFAQAADAMT
jgi:hypothetical protein